MQPQTRPQITVGQLVAGTDVTMGTAATGVVTRIFVQERTDLYREPHEASAEALTRPHGRRHEITTATGRSVIVDHAEPAGDAWEWLLDAWSRTRSTEVRAQLLPLIRHAARLGLDGGARTATIGRVQIRVEAVAGGGFTRLDVRRDGELLLGLSGTHQHEGDALRSFWAVIATALKG